MLGFRARIRRLGSFAVGKPAEVAPAGRCLPETARRSLGRIG